MERGRFLQILSFTKSILFPLCRAHRAHHHTIPRLVNPSSHCPPHGKQQIRAALHVKTPYSFPVEVLGLVKALCKLAGEEFLRGGIVVSGQTGGFVGEGNEVNLALASGLLNCLLVDVRFALLALVGEEGGRAGGTKGEFVLLCVEVGVCRLSLSRPRQQTAAKSQAALIF